LNDQNNSGALTADVAGSTACNVTTGDISDGSVVNGTGTLNAP
jgi:hypothetical protein